MQNCCFVHFYKVLVAVTVVVLLLKRQKFDVYLILSLNKHSYVIWCQYIQDWLFSALWSNKNMCPVNTDDYGYLSDLN